MIHSLIENLIAFGMSIPINLIIIVIICVIGKCIWSKKFTWKTCLKIFVAYLFIGLLLGILGYTMPSFIDAWHWIVNQVKSFW